MKQFTGETSTLRAAWTKKLETVKVIATVDAADQVLEVNARVTTAMSPVEPVVAEFAEVANLLKDRVWEDRLVPMEQALKAEFRAQ